MPPFLSRIEYLEMKEIIIDAHHFIFCKIIRQVDDPCVQVILQIQDDILVCLIVKGGFYSEGTDAYVCHFLKQANLITFLSLNFEIFKGSNRVKKGPEMLLWNREPLKDLNDYKLIVYESN